MFRTLLLGLLVAIAAAGGASAQRTIYGAGYSANCADWQQYRTAGDTEKTSQMQAWIAGYLSGSNMASTGPDFLDDKVDSVEFAIWIDNYCKGKPLTGLAIAVIKLQEELLAKRTRSKPRETR